MSSERSELAKVAMPHLPWGTPVVEPTHFYGLAAKDMKDFCDAAKATVCLYYPASTTLVNDTYSAVDIDPLITDPALCKSQGGLSAYEVSKLFGVPAPFQGCQFLYGNRQITQFDPGAPPYKHLATCDAKYWHVDAYDQKGAVSVSSVQAKGQTFTIGVTPATCLVRVWVTK